MVSVKAMNFQYYKGKKKYGWSPPKLILRCELWFYTKVELPNPSKAPI